MSFCALMLTINAVVGGGDGGWSLLKLKQFVKRMVVIQSRWREMCWDGGVECYTGYNEATLASIILPGS